MDFVVRYAEQKCTEKERRRLKIVELNKENMKKIRWLIAFSVLLYLGVQNLDVVLKYVKIVWGLLLPFVLGGAMAFVLNVPMAFIERHVFGKAKEKENRRGRAAAKFIAILTSPIVTVIVEDTRLSAPLLKTLTIESIIFCGSISMVDAHFTISESLWKVSVSHF